MDLPGTKIPVAACLRGMWLTVTQVIPTQPAIALCRIPSRANASTSCLMPIGFRIQEYFIFNTATDQQGNNMHKQNVHDILTISIFTIIASTKQNAHALIDLSEMPMEYSSTKMTCNIVSLKTT